MAPPAEVMNAGAADAAAHAMLYERNGSASTSSLERSTRLEAWSILNMLGATEGSYGPWILLTLSFI